MKKSHRKEVIRARIIFGIIVAAILAILIGVIAILVHNHNKNKDNTPTQTETQTETQSEIAPDTQQLVTETEDTQAVEETVTVWTTDRVNLRAEANTSSEILTVLEKRTELEKIGEENGFAQVKYETYTGYVSLDYITTEEVTSVGYIVCIDPGHQLHGDSTTEPNGPNSSTMKARVTDGTCGTTTGVAEYELNLDISLQLKDELESRGYTVYMTRTTHDVNISNMERAQYATSVNADITVRIHANGAESSSASGALTLVPSSSNAYVSSLANDSYKLGNDILSAYCAATGLANQGVQANDTMTGINWSTMPVTILELGYMTNPNDDTNMENAAFQQKMVDGIANGIDDYFGL